MSASVARCRRALHKHTTHPARSTARARTARARTAGARNASMGGASTHNASMHSASTKHGPAHPRDVDDVDGRRPHDVDDRYTRLSQAHHTSSTKAHSPSTHSTGTCRRQGPEHAHADDKPHRHERTERTEEEEGEEEDTPRTQHGHAGVRSVKRTAAGSAVPRPCLRSLAAVGRGPPPPGRRVCGAGPREMRLAPGRCTRDAAAGRIKIRP